MSYKGIAVLESTPAFIAYGGMLLPVRKRPVTSQLMVGFRRMAQRKEHYNRVPDRSRVYLANRMGDEITREDVEAVCLGVVGSRRPVLGGLLLGFT